MFKIKTICLSLLLLALIVTPSFATGNSFVDVCISSDGSTGWAIGMKDTSTPAFYQFQNGDWKEIAAPEINGTLKFHPTAVCMSGDGKNAFIAGYTADKKGSSSGMLLEYDGKSWKPMNPGKTEDLHFTSICTDKTGERVWAAGVADTAGFVLKFESGKWSKMNIKIDDTPASWSLTKIIMSDNGRKIFAIGQVRYGSLHDTGLFLKYENGKWQTVDLTPIKDSQPHRRNGFFDVTANEKGTEVWIAGWKQFYGEDTDNPTFHPMICKFDGKALVEVKQDKLPLINRFSRIDVNGKMWVISSEDSGSSVYSFNGKDWKKAGIYPGIELTAISMDKKGQTGFIAGGKKTAKDKISPAILQLTDGKWKNVTDFTNKK